MKKVLLILSFICTVSVFATSPIHANDIDSSYSMVIRVAKNNQVDIELSVDLVNNNKDAVVDSYQVFLPFENLEFHDTKVNGQSTENIVEKISGGYNIRTTFFKQAIQFGSGSKVEIDFSPKNVITESHGLKKMYIPSMNALSSDIKFKLIFPAEFGPISFNSGRNSVIGDLNDYKVMDFKADKSLFFIWGNSAVYNISSELEVKNSRDSEIHYLASLVPEIESQLVDFRAVSGGDIGMSDSFGNHFAFVNLAPNTSKKFSYSARIVKDITKPDQSDFKQFNWPLNLDTTTGQKIYSEINKSPDITEKLRNMNSFLSKELKPNPLVNIDFATLSTVWDRAQNKSAFTPFEYCYFAVTTAEYLGLKAQIDYGYVVIFPKDTPSSVIPHVWCTIQTNDKNIAIDPYLESITGVSYFDITGIDRIKMGTWNASQTYNDILGMLGLNNSLISIKTDEASDEVTDSKEVTLSLDYPKKTFAGEFYSVNMLLKNNSSKVLPIKALTIGGQSQMANIKFNDLQIELLPVNENKLTINNLRETNFLTSETKDIDVELELENYPEKLDRLMTIKFDTDVNLLIFFLTLLIFCMTLLLLIILRLARGKKKPRGYLA